MDWLTFITKIVEAILSLPVAIIVLLLCIRPYLGGLVRRLEELDLPGGTKAKFGRELDQAKESIETEAIISEADDKFLRLANQFPEAAVLQSYQQVEALLSQHAIEFGKGRFSRPANVIEFLQGQGIIDAKTVSLFRTIAEIRNSAVHVSLENRITPGEAIEYRSICEALLLQLAQAFDELKRRG